MHRTKYIVLRKTPFQESSLVVAGVSPDFGRIDFLIKGARSLSRRKFPLYELFRELSIQFREAKAGALSSVQSAEPSESFDEIALRPANYLAACELAGFLLKHSQPLLECQQTYRALKTAFAKLRVEEEPERPVALARLAYLYESGLLPERLSDGEDDASELRRTALLQALLAHAIGEGPEPKLTPEYWGRIAKWTDSLLRYHGLN